MCIRNLPSTSVTENWASKWFEFLCYLASVLLFNWVKNNSTILLSSLKWNKMQNFHCRFFFQIPPLHKTTASFLSVHANDSVWIKWLSRARMNSLFNIETVTTWLSSKSKKVNWVDDLNVVLTKQIISLRLIRMLVHASNKYI